MAGDIAEMMLDGTMDPETGEWNFDGEDGPGFPMTGAEAAEFRRTTGWGGEERPATDRYEGTLYGLWLMIGTALQEGYGTVDQIATRISSPPHRVEDALEMMLRSGLTHRNHGPWKLTKRGRSRMGE